MSTCLYEITVLGNTAVSNESPPEFYNIKFRLLYRFGRYEVWVLIALISLRCGFFDREMDARCYINQAMKTAMMGKFLYRLCVFCGNKNYIGDKLCTKCKTIIYPSEQWMLDETQNEKKSKHLGYLTKHESTLRNSSFVYGPQTAKKLPDIREIYF